MSTKEVKKYKVQRREELLPIMASVLNEYHGKPLETSFWNQLLSSHIHFGLSAEEVLSAKKIKPRRFELFREVNSDQLISEKQAVVLNLKLYAKFLVANHVFNTGQTLYKFESGDHAFNGFLSKTFDGETPHLALNWKLGYLPLFRNSRVRKRLEILAKKYGKEDAFLYNLITRIPLLYVEYLSFFFRKYAVEDFLSSARLHQATPYHPGVALLVAYLKTKGAKVFTYQHGGFYGELDFHPGYEKERVNSDGFVTWGWLLNANDIRGKAFKIKKFLEDYRNSEKNRVDITVIIPKVHSWNQETIKGNLRSINAWALRRNRTIEVRFKLSKYERPLLSLKDFNSLRQADTALSIGQQCARSNLIIHLQHPTTNFLECVAVNQPVLAVLTNNQPSSIVGEFYDFYINENIFFKDLQGLLDFLTTEVDVERHCPAVFRNKKHLAFRSQFVNIEGL